MGRRTNLRCIDIRVDRLSTCKTRAGPIRISAPGLASIVQANAE